MGTRNLTMVIDREGQKKVAQYGQWDGYPEGVGVGVLRFLKNKELFEKLEANLTKVRFLDEQGVDKEFFESYNRNVEGEDNRTEEQKRWYSKYQSRDLAEEVLTNIANSVDEEIILMNSEKTAMEGGWVEYSYVINLQENTLGVYTHIDMEPMKVYSLDELPEENIFVSELE